ncbi:MAG: hypothetical protein ABUK01_17560 [Leptospirales bacterium]
MKYITDFLEKYIPILRGTQWDNLFGGSGGTILIIAIPLLILVFFVTLVPVFRLANRRRKWAKMTPEFKDFLGSMNTDSRYFNTGDLKTDVTGNMKREISDFFVMGRKRDFTLTLNGKDYKSQKKHATEDIWFIDQVMNKIIHSISYGFGLRTFLYWIPIVGPSLSQSIFTSDAAQKNVDDIYKANWMAFYYKAYKAEFEEHFNGDIWK